jgi:tRNA threonylcarbamoyladenosine modification (KEOPS) complex  Pcc1 subunit
MSRAPALWSAVVSVSTRSAAFSGWLERSLAPEVAREVPRATARLSRDGPDRLELAIDAADAGALRAALNTYLGWVELSVATARVAGTASSRGDPPP